MQISDLAKELCISSRTIRLYEQMGLAPPPKRTLGDSVQACGYVDKHRNQQTTDLPCCLS
ncbi:MAG: MerR family DNA-binding transcriptional regulator [Desulfuromonadaceae bacterium]|nr:MerR family DNA-binding transcriptional regulator [Desulfuromonadaceae bacterium]